MAVTVTVWMFVVVAISMEGVASIVAVTRKDRIGRPCEILMIGVELSVEHWVKDAQASSQK